MDHYCHFNTSHQGNEILEQGFSRWILFQKRRLRRVALDMTIFNGARSSQKSHSYKCAQTNIHKCDISIFAHLNQVRVNKNTPPYMHNRCEWHGHVHAHIIHKY